MGVHEMEKGFSLCCLQVQALPHLEHDANVERVDAPAAAAAPAEPGAGDAGISAASNIFGLGAILLLGFQFPVGKVRLLEVFAYVRPPAFLNGTHQHLMKNGGNLLSHGWTPLSSWHGGAQR